MTLHTLHHRNKFILIFKQTKNSYFYCSFNVYCIFEQINAALIIRVVLLSINKQVGIIMYYNCGYNYLYIYIINTILMYKECYDAFKSFWRLKC